VPENGAVLFNNQDLLEIDGKKVVEYDVKAKMMLESEFG